MATKKSLGCVLGKDKFVYMSVTFKGLIKTVRKFKFSVLD